MLTVRDGSKKDWANTPLPELARGNALDAFYTLRIFKELEKEVEELGADKVNEKLYVPLLQIFPEVEYNGMEVDIEVLRTVGRNLNTTIMDIEDVLYSEIPEIKKSDNLSSTVDLREIFFSEEGFGLYAPKFTEKDLPSTDKETLKELRSQIEEELDSRA